MKPVLVTGGTGFIGGHVIEALLERDYAVRALIRDGGALRLRHPRLATVFGDVRDRVSMDAAAERCAAVIHVAASYTFWSPDPKSIYDVNVSGTRNVLQAALRAGVERVVYTSTVATLYPVAERPATEEDVASPDALVGHYKRSKWEAERMVLRMASAGAPIVVVNPTAPVGPADVKPTPTGRIIVDFLRRRMPAVVDTGLNLVHVRDVAEGHVSALECGVPGQRYLLGNAEGNVTLSQMLNMMSDLTGIRAPTIKLPHRAVEALALADTFIQGSLLHRPPWVPLEATRIARTRMWADPSKAIRELGLPQRPVSVALREAANWFMTQGYAPKRALRAGLREHSGA